MLLQILLLLLVLRCGLFWLGWSDNTGSSKQLTLTLRNFIPLGILACSPMASWCLADVGRTTTTVPVCLQDSKCCCLYMYTNVWVFLRFSNVPPSASSSTSRIASKQNGKFLTVVDRSAAVSVWEAENSQFRIPFVPWLHKRRQPDRLVLASPRGVGGGPNIPNILRSALTAAREQWSWGKTLTELQVGGAAAACSCHPPGATRIAQAECKGSGSAFVCRTVMSSYGRGHAKSSQVSLRHSNSAFETWLRPLWPCLFH